MKIDDFDWVPERDLDPLHRLAEDLMCAGRLVDARVVLRAWHGLGGAETVDASPEGPPAHHDG